MRLGYLTHVTGDDPARAYRETVELAVHAEELGYDSFWVAQHHDGHLGGRLASPLVLLAAAAERTRLIRLGTAAVALPLEDPRRLAEDAAALDALSGGRLELGIGVGADPTASQRFGRRHDDRRADTLATLDVLLELLPTALAEQRTWWATASSSDAAADRGLGLLSGKPAVDGSGGVPDLARYWTYARGVPRVALSRPLPAGHSTGRIIDDLLADAALPWAGEVVVQAQPATATADVHREVMERTARYVRPFLGVAGPAHPPPVPQADDEPDDDVPLLRPRPVLRTAR
ncbi:LLM class flavin-dependent oxidoreductase [Pseudonocardia parietis]|uniref:Alkanesulfonate monooxygenase SsuD/methylene tetrahydromethanopterin reductase-like flavin-dependent oxidoreductase (Luciferase family) n=1 Tax=Pseudonocardia parietis TaxID=570936 RepID=A0ABS4W0A1_9PSEU|nr:LLM class flavin-dependent oxidoreductase [Pseudonocardia parietis]MBP2369637.1 alkanesulfonate monooxygenase SsuD/methylene tetrahydromethanopterin reductase-like flavin-dependent oxidoreductase (luciferase family) [Pseudonocardia parietis]